MGFDIHRLAKGRPLFLGGEAIPYPLGLEGHSDADVLVHALMDAMLGAAGLRDIGHYFPPGDPRYCNISSLELLGEVKKLVAGKGYRLVNADMVVIAEAPRLAPHVEKMKKNIARILEVSEGALAVKATTAEGLGPCGCGEAIAAQAVVLLQARSPE
ncbi:MAG: 2-C-methyl-D-erythritol 2,4-cyclodiphosphate synthase [Firmicutes bacterium]|jgi:2-C-methyl-D-erythritol 2,4-cyclodiphosphate synthase|nr:2-C-methyl-D-erythritol 2,4-cyclodiphosphate synthase [Bacillota bacterium]